MFGLLSWMRPKWPRAITDIRSRAIQHEFAAAILTNALSFDKNDVAFLVSGRDCSQSLVGVVAQV